MISEKTKKAVAVIVIIVFGIMMLAGCSGKKESGNETNTENTPTVNEVTPSENQQIGEYFPVFKKTDFNIDKKQIKGYINGLGQAGDKLVLTASDWDGTKAYNYAYIVSQADGSIKEINLGEDDPDGIEVIDSKDGNVYLLMSSGYMTESGRTYINKYDESGKLEKTIELSELIGSDEACQSALVGKNSELIISTLKAVRIIKDDDITVIPDGVGSIKTVFSNDDDILLTIINDSGTKVRKLNQEEKSFDVQKTMVANASGGKYICGGVGPFDFFFRKESMIYGVTFEGETDTEFMDIEKSGINPRSVAEYAIIDENTAFLLCINGELVKMVRAKESEVKEKTVLKAVAVSVNFDTQDLIYEFNAQSENYRIELKEYKDIAWESDSFNLDVVKGELPDMYFLEGLQFKDIPIEKMISLGMLEELDGYYENDDVINKNDIIPSIYEAMKINEKVYFGTTGATISSLVSSTDYVGDRQGWTMKEFTDYIKSLPQDQAAFGMSDTKDDKINMLFNLLGGAYNDFIDYGTGKCSFDGDDFKSLLEACNIDCGKNLYFDPNTEKGKVIKEGTVKFVRVNDGTLNPLKMEIYNNVLEGKDCYPGYPGGSTYRAGFRDCFTMSSQSSNKDGVWEFIRFAMNRENEIRMINEFFAVDEIPVRSDVFDLFLRIWTAKEEFEDEYGETYKPIGPIGTGYGEISMTIEGVSEKEAEQLRKIVESVDGRGGYRQDINKIIMEEAAYYFSGDKDLDEVCRLINNRVETYVSENK